MLQHHDLGTARGPARDAHLAPAPRAHRFTDRAAGARRAWCGDVAHGLALDGPPTTPCVLATATREPVEQRDGLVAGRCRRTAGRRCAGTRSARSRSSVRRCRPRGRRSNPSIAEPALQLSDVVAAQHRTPEIEESVAEPIAALDERRPGLGTADAVDVEAPSDLERAHGGLGRRAEAAVLTLARIRSQQSPSRRWRSRTASPGCRRAAQRQTV